MKNRSQIANIGADTLQGLMQGPHSHPYLVITYLVNILRYLQARKPTHTLLSVELVHQEGQIMHHDNF